MRSSSTPVVFAIVLSTGLATIARAADPPPLPPPAPITVHRAEGPITVDGDLGDPGWKNAATIDQFYETSPGNNVTAKVKTTAYITYDEHYFYIGIRCEDPHPEQIRAPYVDRDAVIGTDDNIAVFLDTRNDKRTAMELRVNPRGIQGDGIYNDTNGNEDFSPDFYYDTAAKIDAGGWSAEYRIPFSSLRYDDKDAQTWNILIWRNYPREFRYAFQSAPIERSSNCYVCHMHPLIGLTGLPSAGHFVAAPYVTAQTTETPEGAPGSPLQRDPLHKNAGIDVKWTPTATNAVDMTVNPDFSQVEADIAQITVNQRFAVFYPEKRPFFLEGFDLFDTPLQVAYTRTITAPRFGARSTGRIGNTAYTLLITDDKGGGLTILPGPLGNDFALQDFKSIDVIGRIRHQLGASFVGAVLTDREIRGGGHNRVLGPDFQWRPGEHDAITGELLFSQNENPNRPDLSSSWNGERSTSHAAYAGWNHNAQKYDWFVEGKDVGNAFRADLGFVPQVGYREVDGGGGLRFYPEHSLLRYIRPNVFVDRQTDLNGNTIYRRFSPGIFVLGAKNLQANAVLLIKNQTRVGSDLLEETYLNWFVQLDPSRRFPRITFNGRAGDMIDFANGRVGKGSSLGLAATVRPLDRLTFEPNISHEWLNIDSGRLYTADVEYLKTTYSFSSKSLMRIITEYVTTNRNPSLYGFPVSKHSGSFLGSVLYSYKINWQTVLFLGYGDDRTITPSNDLVKLDRSLFFKVSYAIQK
jgi:hypothetical protein